MRFYQISLRTILEAVFVLAVLLAFIYWRNVPRRDLGRYQVISADAQRLIFIDTSTGKMWQRVFDGSEWRPLPTPTDPGKSD
ncbi:MAG TPA: hypothetical protein VGI40_24910 [Pirellulaceae bacterium]|jgi:hypothetical protein